MIEFDKRELECILQALQEYISNHRGNNYSQLSPILEYENIAYKIDSELEEK